MYQLSSETMSSWRFNLPAAQGLLSTAHPLWWSSSYPQRKFLETEKQPRQLTTAQQRSQTHIHNWLFAWHLKHISVPHHPSVPIQLSNARLLQGNFNWFTNFISGLSGKAFWHLPRFFSICSVRSLAQVLNEVNKEANTDTSSRLTLFKQVSIANNNFSLKDSPPPLLLLVHSSQGPFRLL